MKSVKKLSVTLAVVSALSAVTLQAATAAQVEAVSKKVAATKAVEAPALVGKLVTKASKEDKQQIAVAALASGLRTHPAAITSLLTAALKGAPESVEALVNTTLDVMPDSGMTVVRVVAEVLPTKSDLVVAAVAKRAPAQKAAAERELAASRARRLVATPTPASAAISGGTVDQQPRPVATPPTQIDSGSVYGGGDPGRP